MKSVCIACGTSYPLAEDLMRCRACQGLLEVQAQWTPARADWDRRPLGVWRYREMLPYVPGKAPVTLGEGGTGLHAAPRMAQWIGVAELYVKNEGENPTGSFKDRGMTVGVSYAAARGYHTVGCASTGNTSASLAAYAARAGLKAVVVVPAGKVALGKLAQALVHGAQVVAVRGNFDQALAAVNRLAEQRVLYLLNSVNPLRLEGQKTLLWEVLDQTTSAGRPAPDRVVYPVGNAGNISAAHKALTEWRTHGLFDAPLMLTGVQAEGAAPLARMWSTGADRLEPVASPDTVATAIRIGDPVSWPKAYAAVKQTGGTFTMVTDDEILAAQRALAELEGLFVEPASAASLAGLRRLVAQGEADKNERVVCITTGNGLKDADAVLKGGTGQVVETEPEADAIRAALGQEVLA